MPLPVRDLRGNHVGAGEELVVGARDLARARVPLREPAELDPQNGGLDLVEPRVVTDDGVVVAGRLPVLAKRAQLLREAIVVRGDAPSLAVRTEVFGAIEREAVHAA